MVAFRSAKDAYLLRSERRQSRRSGTRQSSEQARCWNSGEFRYRRRLMTKIQDPVTQAVATIGKTAQPWRFGGLSPWQVIVRSWQGYSENRFNGRSAQFAYYSMLSLFPL